MMDAVASSTAATYVAPTADVSAASNQDASMAASPSSSTTAPSGAAPPAPSSPTLAPGTVAALVAEQATDPQGGSANAAPADPAPQYTLPATVIANMQAFATTAPTQYTDEINASAAVLADGSTASDSDKLKAWIGLTQLLASGSIYNAGNIADLQKAYTAANGDYEKHVAGVELQYNQIENRLAAPGEAAGQAVNGYQNQLTALNSFSDSDQQILLATMSAAGYHGFSSVYGWQAFDTLDDWKSTLQQEAASFDAQNQAQAPVATAKSSQRASPTAAADSPTGTGGSALAKLPGTAEGSVSTTSSSDIALQVITEAAHRTLGGSDSHRAGATGNAKDAPQTGGVLAPFKSGAYDQTASQASTSQTGAQAVA